MEPRSTILITGGTGSFSEKFVPLTLERFNPKKLIIYSRDEMKQWLMAQKYSSDKRVKFVLGDVRDKERLESSFAAVDYVVHAAATKIVPTAEYNPIECIKTNINGAINVIEASLKTGIKKVISLSTDKASNPINLYGATKLASDKLFIAANIIDESKATKFSVVRYGNVMGSRGSVIPFFMQRAKSGKLPITDENMTRFMITLDQAVDLVWEAFTDMLGGEIYVKKIPSMNIIDIAKAVCSESDYEIIGIRPGEKVHEQMIGLEDSRYTYEYENYYKILPMLNDLYKDKHRIKKGIKVKENFSYTSDSNSEWMTIEYLRNWIKANYRQLTKEIS
tara:strand:- start:208 stop:1212 length:1005 start_codon:yes stop_codon:yes gene_type:complete